MNKTLWFISLSKKRTYWIASGIFTLIGASLLWCGKHIQNSSPGFGLDYPRWALGGLVGLLGFCMIDAGVIMAIFKGIDFIRARIRVNWTD